MRIASNTRRKDNSTGEWVDKPNYFDVTVWGAQGENVARYCPRAVPSPIDGRLEWREWDDQGRVRSAAVQIIADSVQFLGGRDDANGGGNGGARYRSRATCRPTRATSPRRVLLLAAATPTAATGTPAAAVAARRTTTSRSSRLVPKWSSRATRRPRRSDRPESDKFG